MKLLPTYNTLFLRFAWVILIGYFPMKVLGVPAYPNPVHITQPDGSVLTIRIHGDEFRNFRTTVDSFLIKKNDRGFYTIAEKDSLNRWVVGQRVAKNPDRRTLSDHQFLRRITKIDSHEAVVEQQQVRQRMVSAQRVTATTTFPKVGSPRTLVILVNFTDQSFVVPNPLDAFTRLLNQENYSDFGGTGSARDYFRSASYGLFNPQFDVVGPFTLPNNMAFYGANDASGNDERPAHMIVDACRAADLAGVDFRQYDLNSDGIIDNVFVFYAGFNEAEGAHANTVWPHRWAVQPGFNFSGTLSSVRFDGLTLFDYACTSELKGISGANKCGVGIFIHEFSHVIGLPDYYHTVSDKPTLGSWSVMDQGAFLNGSRTPPHLFGIRPVFYGLAYSRTANFAGR